MREHIVLSLKKLAGNSCKVVKNVLCPAVIVSPGGIMWLMLGSMNDSEIVSKLKGYDKISL